MIKLKKAKIDESEKILEFYRNIIDSIRGSEFKPKWSKHYPNLEFIKESIGKGELYICTIDADVISSVVLNNRFNPEYENIDWIVDARPQEIVIIHTFAVASDFSQKGIGREIFKQIKTEAEKNRKKTIRIDIINGNIGAQKVFEKFGFEYIDTAEIFHNAIGVEKFHLYEYAL